MVDLPEPDGPISTVMVFLASVNSRSAKTILVPNAAPNSVTPKQSLLCILVPGV